MKFEFPECVYPAYKGTFTDPLAAAQTNQLTCQGRAVAFRDCQTRQAVTATYLSDGVVVASSTAARIPETKCEITVPECIYPAYQGTFKDVYSLANSNSATCMARAAPFQNYCNTFKPVTAQYFEDGVVTAKFTSPEVKPASGKLGLIGSHQHLLRRSSISANAGFATIYSLTIPAKAGQILRIQSQVESTNNENYNVTMCARVLVDGVVVSATPCENNHLKGAHHLPMWVDATHTVSYDHSSVVTVQLSAARGDASPSDHR